MTYVDDPVVTAEYDAIAAAFRPHARDGDIAMTLPQAVGLAATAVAAVLESERAAREQAHALARDTTAEAQAVLARAEVDAEALRANAVASVEAMRVELAAARLAASGRAERMAVLEAVAVQAAARWGHEGGPSPVRDVLVAAGVI